MTCLFIKMEIRQQHWAHNRKLVLTERRRSCCCRTCCPVYRNTFCALVGCSNADTAAAAAATACDVGTFPPSILPDLNHLSFPTPSTTHNFSEHEIRDGDSGRGRGRHVNLSRARSQMGSPRAQASRFLYITKLCLTRRCSFSCKHISFYNNFSPFLLASRDNFSNIFLHS